MVSRQGGARASLRVGREPSVGIRQERMERPEVRRVRAAQRLLFGLALGLQVRSAQGERVSFTPRGSRQEGWEAGRAPVLASQPSRFASHSGGLCSRLRRLPTVSDRKEDRAAFAPALPHPKDRQPSGAPASWLRAGFYARER